jgi:hypothetical protein
MLSIFLISVLLISSISITTRVNASTLDPESDFGSISDSDERDNDDTVVNIKFHGNSLLAKLVKQPEEWPQFERDGETYVLCHPLAPCFVKTFKELSIVLEASPLAVVGVDPYHLYDASNEEQHAHDMQWLSPFGQEHADEIEILINGNED